MGKLALGYDNQIDTATLSGGSWSTSYPRSNLQTRQLALQARTVDALAASSVLILDCGSAQNIGVVALVNHNLQSTATVRIQGSTVSDFATTVYDSGADVIYAGTDYGVSFTETEARYWKISISDTSNPDGYIAIGRVFLGWIFQPTINIAYTPSMSVESTTIVQETLGGQEYFDLRPNRRVFQGSWDALTDYEAYSLWLRIQRGEDVSGEVFLIQDDGDVTYQAARNFLGRIRSLDAFENPYLDRHQAGFEIAELL